jgi:hypothetical protein
MVAARILSVIYTFCDGRNGVDSGATILLQIRTYLIMVFFFFFFKKRKENATSSI